MSNRIVREISYFPGCSLATSARESNSSLRTFCEMHGIRLVELKDWNCCGSSSAHSINSELGHYLPSRNLSLAPPKRPLLAACPSCFLRLKLTHMEIKKDSHARAEYQAMWHRRFDEDLQIINFFDLLSDMIDAGTFENNPQRLRGLKFAPYYGCMMARPPSMRHERKTSGLMEKVLTTLGAEPVRWMHSARCCGTFLSVSRPDIAAKIVNQIMESAALARAECIVTACAMCHLNLEIRSKIPDGIPVLYFSELLSLSMGVGSGRGWFRRHLIDPRPMLRSKKLIA